MADRLSMNSSAAIKLGMSYGQYMAMQYDAGQIKPAQPKPEPEGDKVCPICGKRFFGRNGRKYCTDDCYRERQKAYNAARRKEMQKNAKKDRSL